MSEFGKPKDCINGCGALIYFDAHSSVGHPTADKWIPLEYKEGRKTDTVHDCPKKRQNGSYLTAEAKATAVETTKPELKNLDVIKAIHAALGEYISIKEEKR